MKRSNSVGIALAAMPMPVSLTASRSVSARLAPGSMATLTCTVPSSVNLIALPIRLNRICWMRITSPRMIASSLGVNSSRSARPLATARSRISATTPSTAGRTLNGAVVSCRWPASMRETSRMSLISASSSRPELPISSAWRRCCESRLECSISSLSPSTAFSGVRISWLMVARNCDLAWLAASAFILACASRRSAAVTSWNRLTTPPSRVRRSMTWTTRPLPRSRSQSPSPARCSASRSSSQSRRCSAEASSIGVSTSRPARSANGTPTRMMSRTHGTISR